MKKKDMILSGAVGHALEAYDMTLCGFLSFFISKNFFPIQSINNGLLKFFSVFLIGYLSRPLGGVVFGFFADVKGRKAALQISLIIMGLSTAAISLIPTYSSIGATATWLLILFRILQGISAGGEYVIAMVFLLEHSSPQNKGAVSSWAAAGLNAGSLVASIGAALITFLINSNYLPSWSWRILFLLAIPGVALGCWVRHKTQETLEFILNNSIHQENRLKTISINVMHFLKQEKASWITAISLTWFGTCFSFMVFIYSPTHIVKTNILTSTQALIANSISILIIILLIPLFGKASDRFGRKPFLLLPALFLLIFAYPFFSIISYGSFIQIILAYILISIPAASFFSIAPTTIAEILPSKIRCITKALVYGVPASVFGASSPLVSLKLYALTEMPTSPAYYLMFCAVLSLVVTTVLLKEPILVYKKLNPYSLEFINQ